MSMSTKTIATTEMLIKILVKITRILRIFFCFARSIFCVHIISHIALTLKIVVDISSLMF